MRPMTYKMRQIPFFTLGLSGELTMLLQSSYAAIPDRAGVIEVWIYYNVETI